MIATAKEVITHATAMKPQSHPKDRSDMNYFPAIEIKNSSEACKKDLDDGLPEAEQVPNMAVHSTESLAGTKLIFVVGKTGTGKTTILAELTGLEGLNPGETIDAGTKEYSVCPAIIDDEQYLFIDTAGFGDPKRNDLDIFRDTITCLMSFGPFVQVVGVLFVIGRPGTRLEQQDVKTLRWVQCFCGPAFLRNVTFVTGFWDSYSKSAFKQAYKRMQSLLEDEIVKQALEPSDSNRRYHGVHIYHHGVTGGVLTPDAFPGLDLIENAEERKEELRNLIRRRYSELRFKPAKLQFKQEVEDRTPFLLTEAAKVLRSPVDSTAVKFVNGKCVLRKAIESHDASPLHFEQAPDQEPTGWAQGIRDWFELARRVSSYFQEVRRKESTSFGSGVQHAWNDIRAWWSGKSDEA
ncbi:unnamed protein product [Clonostachys rhizophaga]|uniref:G domain-containing protein n=1 Tax=Clonostachys rhizophaga TaxID=160324 RepID=A0A9N9W4I4_9HYPO|nr:unnamed protein product [Clonostachys rhizophaga]